MPKNKYILSQNKHRATAQYENYYYENQRKLVVGMDEAGRGALAGPVVGVAVYIHPHELNDIEACDSKLLNFEQRAEMTEKLRDKIKVGVGMASVREIDALNVLQATFLAWKRALKELALPFDWLLVDGNMVPPEYKNHSTPLIKGDRNCVSIAVASIYAKHLRDQIMISLHEKYDQYDWRRNKGYGTLQHRLLIKEHGLCNEHRKSFRC